ncbi:hypothetical protein [Acinetobacter nosocomialis]|uniref:hypothetical protein n=1 Tax=Acinetobacter nosocomialis TaxID=106654 RepID=UPI0033A28CF1
MNIEAPKYYRGGECPVEIEAIQYDGSNGSQIELWLGIHCSTDVNAVLRNGGNIPSDYHLNIPGAGTAKAGDYVAKNTNGTLVIIEENYFENEFQKIEPTVSEDAEQPVITNDGALKFLLKFCNGFRIVSTGDLTDFQIAEARAENRIYIEPNGGLGWVALPWQLTTVKDRQREKFYLINKKLIEQTDKWVVE